MIEFFQSIRGAKFYDADVPRIAVALERIATALEAHNAAEVKRVKEGQAEAEEETNKRP